MTKPKGWQILLTVLIAVIFWYLTFRVKMLNFWLSMSIAVTILTILSFYFAGMPLNNKDITVRNFILGIVSAGVLYGIFVVGNLLSQVVLNFAKAEVLSIYDIRSEGQAIIITLILFFVTSPGEELYWRGYLQEWIMERVGGLQGWVLSSIIYAGVHIASGNVMLVMPLWSPVCFGDFFTGRPGIFSRVLYRMQFGRLIFS